MASPTSAAPFVARSTSSPSRAGAGDSPPRTAPGGAAAHCKPLGPLCAAVLSTETPQVAFANDPTLNSKLNAKLVPPGSVLIGGKNFGCGSSREQAVSCLKGWELPIVANDISRIFLQNAINLGLDIITAPGVEASEGDEVVVEGAKVVNHTTGKSWDVVPLPPARQTIIDAGGLITFTRKRMLEAQAKG